MKYFNVIVKNRSKGADKLFLYRFEEVKESFCLDIGDKVIVPFGNSNKLVEAYIAEEFNNLDEIKEIKDFDSTSQDIKNIHSLVEKNYIERNLIELLIWMRQEYLASYLDIIDLFLPSGKKPERKENNKLDRTLKIYDDKDKEKIELTYSQSKVLREILESYQDDEYKKFLLQGVTASGKTEVYIQASSSVLNQGNKALVLVPEIFLTKQLVEKFRSRLELTNDEIAIIHSSLKNRELHEEWEKIKNRRAKLVIGSRMAIFTPIDKLKLIIVDEEHSDSYKSERSPKYNSLDVVEKLAEINDSTLVLGSATPSMRSLMKAENNLIKHLFLSEKYSEIVENRENEIHLIDMRKELRAGNRTVFSRKLYDSIKESLEKQEQSLLILGGTANRFLSCRNCGDVVKCPKCKISLRITSDENLKCSYCSHQAEKIKICPSCNSNLIKSFGLDILTLEEEVKRHFPNAIVDSLQWKDSSNIKEIGRKLKDLEKGKIDILISTQLLSRGMDLKNITTVGIVALDSLINSFDFRGGEKTFQLIVHGGGRAGRGELRGRVIVQTYKPDFYAIKYAINNDVSGFYKEEKSFRKTLGYYPFGDILQVNISSKNLKGAERKYYKFLDVVRKAISEDYILAKKFVNNKESENFRFYILFKLDKENLNKVKKIVRKFEDERGKERYTVHFSIDLNPKKLWRN